MKRFACLALAAFAFGSFAPAQSVSFATDGKHSYAAALTPIKSGSLLPLNLTPTWSWNLQAVAVSQIGGPVGIGTEFDIRKSWNSFYVYVGVGAVAFGSTTPRGMLFLGVGAKL